MFEKVGNSKANFGLIVLTTLLINSINAELQEVASSDKSVKEQPIVIHTQVQSYDQPTLGEYQICQENLEKCLHVCETTANRTACEKECPTCPILINQDVVVQGVNDTDYRQPPVAGTGNTTTVIRLTNEIRNIIDNTMGNITALNENNIHVHQNISTSGGKYGLGYNQNGSCCIVIRASKNCDQQQFSTAALCHHKRHRVCGEKCTARVLRAKRVTKCTEPTSADEMPTCHQTIAYEPYHRATRTTMTRRRSRCQRTEQWPYVMCRNRSRRQRSNYVAQCQRCYELPYIYILQQRIPRRCYPCFSATAGLDAGYYGYGNAFMPTPPCYITNTCYPVFPFYAAPNYPLPPVGRPIGGGGGGDDNFEDEEFLPGDGWTIESTKCRNPDGTISDNCNNNDVGSGDGSPIVDDKPPVTEAPLEVLPEPEDDYDYADYNDNELNENNDDDYLNGPEIVRHRRKTHFEGFKRSIYSRRHRKNKN